MQTTFIDLIIKERGYEFQYEGKRWLELKRTGKAAEIILAVRVKRLRKSITCGPCLFQS